MHVLIVKMSSMGDIIHTLPAVSDAVNALPNIQFDWVAEEVFTEIPTWHNNVQQVIPIALRRWRKKPWRALQKHEIQQFYQQLRLQHYDKVIDAQGSIKSAITTRMSRGFRVGMDKNSVREKFTDLAYQKKFSVPRKQHAINRLRQLFAQALEYPLPETTAHYGILKERLNLTSMKLDLPDNYVIFVPNASWTAKCWPENSWSLLLEKTAGQQIPVYIPWGNQTEKKRAERLSGNHPYVNVLPALSLSEIAILFSHAKTAVCVDTGLSHLAAALATPTITLYGPTDPRLIGTMGPAQIHLQSNYSSKTALLEIPVETVWQTLSQVINNIK
ncbi:MAG: lipopolysaccharide heptosyltransferase I [Rickettsiella sp.]|nr:lipopolysaccharide heptosyltransferase I [Rickettsiella sp.]